MTTLKEAFESGKLVPYNDILTGKITENSFAVSFHAVLNGYADKIYNDPTLYFQLTHMTKNLGGIFNDVLTRVSIGGARPLLVIDTTFGGGKTHALVGLYHLFKNPIIAQSNNAIQSILNEVKLENIHEISMVAIDCHNISSVKKGADARTLWGEIGKQLRCYDLVESFDKELKRPDASTLTKMINSTGKPVLIMIDELVNHLKDAKAEKVGDTNLAEITVSFFHTMTDVIVNSKNAMFIVTLPGTESAYKKEAEMLEEYKKMVKELGSREASFTVPMEKSEIYEVIKKRLFEKIDEIYTRQVAEELQQFYIRNSESFPDEVVQTSYYEKIKKSYPFHPALIDLLYERISTINEFQKTRGVLRLLSHVLRNVYSNVHVIPDDIIITPGIIDLNEDTIFQELTNKIARGEFQNVIKTDIVNDESEGKCQKLDLKDNFGSSIRIATSIYLHTLIGTTKEASIGCSQNELLLSTAVDKVTYPKDVLNEVITLENNLWYIYQKTGKWYFSVEVNINKVISDETDKVSKLEYDQEIKRRLRKMLEVSDYFDVHIWEHDVRNPFKPTLVVVNYNDIKGSEDKVPDGVKEIVDKEGTSFRTKKNLIYVLVPREDRISKIKDAARRFIAIKEIKNSVKSKPEIKTYSSKIDELLKESESNLNASIELCYSLIYYPRGTEIKYLTVQDGYEGAKNLPDKVYMALVKAKKIVEKLAPIYIVDKILESKTEITVNEIHSNFEESPSYLLPKNKEVLFDAISDGLENKLFGLYISGIGDILSITESNYEKIGSNFYFNRVPSSGPRDAHYILPKKRAEAIENILNSFSKKQTEVKGSKGASTGTGITYGGKGGLGGGGQISDSVFVDISDISKVGEYKDWDIQNMSFAFSNVRIFPQLQTRLSLMLLGVSDVKHSVNISSENMNLSINEAEISDLNSLIDILFKISNMFPDDLNAKLELSFSSELKIDDDLVDTINQLTSLGDVLEFKSKLKK